MSCVEKPLVQKAVSPFNQFLPICKGCECRSTPWWWVLNDCMIAVLWEMELPIYLCWEPEGQSLTRMNTDRVIAPVASNTQFKMLMSKGVTKWEQLQCVNKEPTIDESIPVQTSSVMSRSSEQIKIYSNKFASIVVTQEEIILLVSWEFIMKSWLVS